MSKKSKGPLQKHTHKYALISLFAGIVNLFIISIWYSLVNSSMFYKADLTFTILYFIFLVLSILAIVFGIIALIKIKHDPYLRGTGQAILGIACGSIPLVADIWLFVNSTFFTI
jgi:hypothetical protein